MGRLALLAILRASIAVMYARTFCAAILFVSGPGPHAITIGPRRYPRHRPRACRDRRTRARPPTGRRPRSPIRSVRRDAHRLPRRHALTRSVESRVFEPAPMSRHCELTGACLDAGRPSFPPTARTCSTVHMNRPSTCSMRRSVQNGGGQQDRWHLVARRSTVCSRPSGSPTGDASNHQPDLLPAMSLPRAKPGLRQACNESGSRRMDLATTPDGRDSFPIGARTGSDDGVDHEVESGSPGVGHVCVESIGLARWRDRRTGRATSGWRPISPVQYSTATGTGSHHVRLSSRIVLTTYVTSQSSRKNEPNFRPAPRGVGRENRCPEVVGGQPRFPSTRKLVTPSASGNLRLGHRAPGRGGRRASIPLKALPTLLSALRVFCLWEFRVFSTNLNILRSICSVHRYPAQRAGDTFCPRSDGFWLLELRVSRTCTYWSGQWSPPLPVGQIAEPGRWV